MGGVGFFGLYFCECFFVEGYEVVCFDNFFIGLCVNIEYLLDDGCFSLVEYDISMFFVYELKIDIVMYFVLLVSLIDYFELLIQMFKVGLFGIYYGLGIVCVYGVWFFLVFILEVYGDLLVYL